MHRFSESAVALALEESELLIAHHVHEMHIAFWRDLSPNVKVWKEKWRCQHAAMKIEWRSQQEKLEEAVIAAKKKCGKEKAALKRQLCNEQKQKHKQTQVDTGG